MIFSEQPCTSSPIWGYHQFSANKYFHLPKLVGQKDFHLPKRNFYLPNGSLVGAFRHPAPGGWGQNNLTGALYVAAIFLRSKKKTVKVFRSIE